MPKRLAISAPTCFDIATQSSIVTTSIGMNGTTSAAPHPRMCAFVFGQVDQLCGLADAADGGFLNGFPLADQRDHAAVVIGIHLPVEKIHARHLHGFNDRIDLGLVTAFREIWNAFNECVGHERKDKSEAVRGGYPVPGCLRARLNVLVAAEAVIGIVFCFNRAEPCVVRTIGFRNPASIILVQSVDVDGPV